MQASQRGDANLNMLFYPLNILRCMGAVPKIAVIALSAFKITSYAQPVWWREVFNPRDMSYISVTWVI